MQLLWVRSPIQRRTEGNEGAYFHYRHCRNTLYRSMAPEMVVRLRLVGDAQMNEKVPIFLTWIIIGTKESIKEGSSGIVNLVQQLESENNIMREALVKISKIVPSFCWHETDAPCILCDIQGIIKEALKAADMGRDGHNVQKEKES